MRTTLVTAFAVAIMLTLSSAMTGDSSTEFTAANFVELQHPAKPAGGFSQEPLPEDFEEASRRRFGKITEPEVTFEQYLEFEKEEFRRQRQLGKDRRLRYLPGVHKSLPGVPHEIPACGSGDFESVLDTTRWQGAYGTVPANGNPVFTTFTAGITPGNTPGLITNANSRQTWVSTGTDPNVGIPRTGPNSSGQASSGAVRIGNAAGGSGSELLSKTFTVNSMQIKFWYAVVFHRTLHPVHQVPSFWVRVTDQSGNVIPGLVNLGNGRDKVVGDTNADPFLQIKPGLTHFYTNWSCAQITFPRRLVGKIVTVEFITEDCAQFGHHGYAYLDNFCGQCPGAPH